jgi:hypothetical protein
MTYYFLPNPPETLAELGIRYCLTSGPDERMSQAGCIWLAAKTVPGPQNPTWVLYENPLPVTPFYLTRDASPEFLQQYRLSGNEMEIELPPIQSPCDVVATFLALPGSKAWLDGRRVPIQQAENWLIRVHVDPNQAGSAPRKLVLKYAPCSNTYLLACPLLSLGVALLACWLIRTGEQRLKPSTS